MLQHSSCEQHNDMLDNMIFIYCQVQSKAKAINIFPRLHTPLYCFKKSIFNIEHLQFNEFILFIPQYNYTNSYKEPTTSTTGVWPINLVQYNGGH